MACNLEQVGQGNLVFTFEQNLGGGEGASPVEKETEVKERLGACGRAGQSGSLQGAQEEDSGR